jgi:succinate dehydrogenase / fumarate reductase iron-sulfur subunit
VRRIFRIKRFDPERNVPSGWEDFQIHLEPHERVLDGLIRIKDGVDGTLTFRRSCAHGICGSCAMRINGKNSLACQCLAGDLPGRVRIEPLPALPVIKDLVVDMERFFEQNDNVLPYLINDEPPPGRERPQSPAEQRLIAESVTCIMCASCSTSCPGFDRNGNYLGPSALLKAYRFIFDSRDRAALERLRRVSGTRGIFGCRSVFDCVEVCPKDIDVAGHIGRLRRLAVKRRLGGS